MAAVACTLFEKHYHYGVAALINSLYRHGYRGSFYAGYKGSLPAWCSEKQIDKKLDWPGASTIEVAEGLQVHLLPINDEYHFVFYKPSFMVELFKTFPNDIDAVAYFDPDIVIKCKWQFYETWMSHGVAMVHENTDRPRTHPLRREWEKVIRAMNRETTRHLDNYINSGFCGVTRQNIEFLTTWMEVIEVAIKHFNLSHNKWYQTRDRTYLFYNADQDAFNVAAMCCTSPISEIGPEGMDFIPGGFTMSHALGLVKPWRKKFIRSALQGRRPTLAEKWYWSNAKKPISLYSNNYFRIKVYKIYIASFISRFYTQK